jgi:hypothetical protein
MQKQKGISTLVGVIIIIAVAIILFGSIFAYQYFAKSQIPITNNQQNSNVSTSTEAVADRQNTTNETAGWKTYTNDEYEFKYASEWTSEEKNKVISLYKNYRSASTPQYPNDGMKYDAKIDISIGTGTAGFGDRPDIISSTNIEIDGYQAIRQVTTFGTDRTLSYKVSLDNGSDLVIYLYSNDANDQAVLDKIMQTFKFTK